MTSENREPNQVIDFEPTKDVFMSLLPQMLAEHKNEFVAIMVGGDKPFFGKGPLDALYAAKEECGKDSRFLVQQVSDEYIKFGRDGKPVEIPSMFL